MLAVGSLSESDNELKPEKEPSSAQLFKERTLSPSEPILNNNNTPKTSSLIELNFINIYPKDFVSGRTLSHFIILRSERSCQLLEHETWNDFSTGNCHYLVCGHVMSYVVK